IDVSEGAARHFGGEDYVARWRELPRCVGCGRPMRPWRTRWREWPAAVTRSSQGKCSACYNQSRLTAQRVRDIPRPKTRSQIASGWTEEQHAAAWVICGSAGSVTDAERIMSLLGLLEESDLTLLTSLSSIRPPLEADRRGN